MLSSEIKHSPIKVFSRENSDLSFLTTTSSDLVRASANEATSNSNVSSQFGCSESLMILVFRLVRFFLSGTRMIRAYGSDKLSLSVLIRPCAWITRTISLLRFVSKFTATFFYRISLRRRLIDNKTIVICYTWISPKSVIGGCVDFVTALVDLACLSSLRSSAALESASVSLASRIERRKGDVSFTCLPFLPFSLLPAFLSMSSS